MNVVSQTRNEAQLFWFCFMWILFFIPIDLTAKESGYCRVNGRSDSMGKVLEPGISYYYVMYFESIKVGDIVRVRVPNGSKRKIVVHRVYASKNGIHRTRGNKNLFPDDFLVTEENYRGTIKL